MVLLYLKQGSSRD